jgi:hypothetical protein
MKIQIHRASDGKDFDTKDACDKHEEGIIEGRLVGLSPKDIENPSPELSSAFEWAGNKCAAARRASGNMKRKPKAEK